VDREAGGGRGAKKREGDRRGRRRSVVATGKKQNSHLALCSQALLLGHRCLRGHDTLDFLLLFVFSNFKQGQDGERKSRERGRERKREGNASTSISLTVKLSFEMMPAVAFSFVRSEPEEGRGWGCSLTAASGASWGAMVARAFCF